MGDKFVEQSVAIVVSADVLPEIWPQSRYESAVADRGRRDNC